MMKQMMRWGIILVIFILMFLSFGLFLWLSDLFLSIWEKLLAQPLWFQVSYAAVFCLFIVLLLWVAYRLSPLWMKKSPTAVPAQAHVQEPVNIEQVQHKLDRLKSREVDTRQLQLALDDLKQDEGRKDIYITLFGDISSGKSSLIKSLLPRNHGEISVLGGTTQTVTRYQWQSPLGEKIIIADTPGHNEAEQLASDDSEEAVIYSHIAIYLCEGDLTATQFELFKQAAQNDKPLLLALNKSDRYTPEQIKQIKTELKQKVQLIRDDIPVISMQSGGVREVSLVFPDGTKKLEQRPVEAKLDELITTIACLLERSSLSEMENLRQQAVLTMLNKRYEKTVLQYQREKSGQIIHHSTKKAVIAAVASVTPGTDLIIQSYFAVKMVQELCAVYEVPVEQVDIENLLALLQKNTIGVMPLLLGVAGNAFKAFPGIGTITGGLLHAVAYGLIFDSIGKAVNLTLSMHGTINPQLIDSIYKEKLVDKLESRTFALVKAILKSKTTAA